MAISLPGISTYFNIKSYKTAVLCIAFLMALTVDHVSAQCNFKALGHRGGSSFNFPENTLVSLEQGFLEGIYAAEIDIRYTSDSVLVLMHDAYIDRTTNGLGFVNELPWSYLKTLDAGSWKAPQYKGTPVPTLVDALKLAHQYNKKLYLNMKVFVPKLIAKALREANVPEDIVLLDPDDFDRVATYHKILPYTPLVYFGALPEHADDASFYEFLKDNGVVAIEIPADYIRLATDDYYVKLRDNAHAHQMELWAYTVNDVEYFKILKDFGIEGLETDRPAAAYEFFCNNGAGGYFPEKRITGQWDFKNSLLGTIGSQLTAMGDTSMADQKIRFGTTASFKLPKIEDQDVSIARIPAFDAEHALRFYSNIAPETLPGVLECDNTYTLVFDLLKPAGVNAYTSLFQTSNNNSDDGDIFFKGTTNSFGILSQYKGSFTDSTWVRIALVFDLYNEKLDEYLNGELAGTVNLINSQDGRFCINNNWGVQSSNFFSDNDGETNPLFVSSIQLRNYAMNANEVKLLGAPTASKIDQIIRADASVACPEFSEEIRLTDTDGGFTLEALAGDTVNYHWEMNSGTGWQNISGTAFLLARNNQLTIASNAGSINNYRFRLAAFNDCTTYSDEYLFLFSSVDTKTDRPQDEMFAIFPNPSKRKVNINFILSSQNYDLTVYSMLGIPVLKKQRVKGNCQVDMPPGTYVVEVSDGHRSGYKKLIISQ